MGRLSWITWGGGHNATIRFLVRGRQEGQVRKGKVMTEAHRDCKLALKVDDGTSQGM